MTDQKHILKTIYLPLAVLGMVLALITSESFAAPAARNMDEAKNGTNTDLPQVRLVTSLGDIVLELDQIKAPNTVENFLAYVKEGFYNGTIFHRVIDGFMVQGGGFTQDFQKKPTRAPIDNEANNGLKNLNGTIAMARTNNPNSATAQFFINVTDNGFLDFRSATPRGWGYAVFGKVIEGMDVVDAIRRSPTGSGGPFRKDVPKTPIVIQSAMLEKKMPAIPMTPDSQTPPSTPNAVNQ